MEHVAIQKENRTFIDLGSLDILCRCKSKKDPPYNKIQAGDKVYVAMGGRIKLQTSVVEAVSLESQNIDEIRKLCKGTTLYDADDYWNEMREKGNRRYGTVVRLTNQEMLDPPIQSTARSYGWDWFVLDTPEKRRAWLGD